MALRRIPPSHGDSPAAGAAIIHGGPGGHVELHGLGQRLDSRAEVENPQRNYPRAMIAAAMLTAFTYVLPLLAMAIGGFSRQVSRPATGTTRPRSLAASAPVLALWPAASSVASACSMRS